jgi:hypothetical protein
MTLSSSSRRESIIHATTPPLCHRCRIETARWVATSLKAHQGVHMQERRHSQGHLRSSDTQVQLFEAA